MSLFEWLVLGGIAAVVFHLNALVRLAEQQKDSVERHLEFIREKVEGLDSIKYSTMMASEHLWRLVENDKRS